MRTYRLNHFLSTNGLAERCRYVDPRAADRKAPTLLNVETQYGTKRVSPIFHNRGPSTVPVRIHLRG